MGDAPFAGRSLHFIGIGGAGMSGLALVAIELGARVSGSDQAYSPVLERLRAAGAAVAAGHDVANLPPGADVVVSTAIPEDNVELAAARAAGAAVLHRAQLLGELSRMKRTIAVTGAHGKTTTASMAAHALRGAGRDPAFLIGGELRSAATNAGWGAGEWAVIEADESDRSFLELARDVAVITNIELDHHATYASLRELEEAMEEFARPAELRVIGPEVELPGELLRVGIGPGQGLRAEAMELLPLGSRFSVQGTAVELPVPGRHNVLNALAALAACRAAGLDLPDAAAALADFDGAGRRFESHGRSPAGALVYDDYAHHPTEVRATLEAARTLAEAEGRRLVACFQPHLYSRTQALAREFGSSLALADVVVVVEVYAARERAEDFPGVNGLMVAEAAADAAGGRPVWWLPQLELAQRMLEDRLGARGPPRTLGAGGGGRLPRGVAGVA